MWPCKNIFHNQVWLFIVLEPTHKTETRRAYRSGTTNSKPPGPIIMIAQSENTEHQLNQIYYTLFSRCRALLRIIPATPNCEIMLSQNPFLAKSAYFGFSSSNLTVQITYSAPLEMLLQDQYTKLWIFLGATYNHFPIIYLRMYPYTTLELIWVQDDLK
jgi:hypothetical protein